MSEDEISNVIEEDYYACLNISREATQEEIVRAYRRWSRQYHPDKHTDAEQKKKADLLFSKIKKAYEVLSDPHQRAIYDTFGTKGLKIEGWEIVQRTKTPLEIREEYEKLARERHERRLLQRTNPRGNVTVNVNATDIFNSYDIDVPDDYERPFFPTIEVSGLSISQSIQAPLSSRNTVTLSGNLKTQNGTGAGSFMVSCQRILHANGWIEGGIAVGNGPLINVKLFHTLTQSIFGNIGVLFKHTPSGPRVGLGMTLDMPLDHHTHGYLTWNVGTPSNVTAMVVRNTDRLHTNLVFRLGVSNSSISVNQLWKINKEDLKLGVFCKIGTINSVVECRAEKKVSEQSSLSAIVSVGLSSGVILEVKIVRAHQTYSFPIHLCEEPQLIPSVYAVVTPLVVWIVIKKLIVDPMAKETKEKEIEKTREINRKKMEEKRREAKVAVDLLRATFEKIRSEEESRNGLIILKAVYGKDANIVTKEENPTPSQTCLVIDVTLPLQCLVKNSELVLHGSSKSQLLGFYDPCVGEDKVLFIQYLFHSHMYEATIKDEEAVRLPKQAHRVSGT